MSEAASAWENKGDIGIGNDVWIGYEAVIMAGVTVGDGAIIGTRTVVTKDVPAYTIVAGLPAQLIRRRFFEETIATLLHLQWWDWLVDHIRNHLRVIRSGDLKRMLLL